MPLLRSRGFFIACVEALCLFRLNINRCKTVKYLKNIAPIRIIVRIFTYQNKRKTHGYESNNIRKQNLRSKRN